MKKISDWTKGVILIVFTITVFIIGAFIYKNSLELESELDSIISEARISSFRNGYYMGVISILENGTYSELRFKQDSIEFINILKQ